MLTLDDIAVALDSIKENIALLQTDLEAFCDNKADKISGLTGNFPVFDPYGELSDSGTSAETILQQVRDADTALDAKHIARTSLLCANNAPQHNAVWGGRNIGSALTAEQSTEIRAGRFTDIYVGDYWDIPVPAYSWTDSDGTVHNESEGTIRFRVADCDYMIQTGDVKNYYGGGLYTHHVAVVPDTALYTARMNAADTTAGGYIGSEMYKNNLKRAEAIFTAAFGSGHLLKYRELYSNAVDLDTEQISGEAWVKDRVLDLMNEAMVRGDTFHTGQTFINEFRKTQLAVFRMNPALCVCGSGTGRHEYWLNTPKDATNFAVWSRINRCVTLPASDEAGVRPCALVY